MDYAQNLKKNLETHRSRLESIKRKLTKGGIQTTDWDIRPLSRKKDNQHTFLLTFKELHSRKEFKFIVKFNGYADSWTKVEVLNHILMTIKRDTKRGYNTRVIPVQSVIHLSNSEEAKIIGTEFLILEFVEGRTFANIYELYVATLKDGRSIKHPLIECIREMGNIHNYHWICTLSQEIMKFKNSQQFWSKQVDIWDENFQRASKGSKGKKFTDSGFFDDFDQHHSSHEPRPRELFSVIRGSVHPSHVCTGLVHGNLDISNFVFNREYEVVAILDWKYNYNCDPMMDLAYFLMMFLEPSTPNMKGIPLLISSIGKKPGITETEIIDLYKSHVFDTRGLIGVPFSYQHLYFAKAVSCCRLLAVLQDAKHDDFYGHASGQYKRIRSNPKELMNFLTQSGLNFYRKYKGQ